MPQGHQDLKYSFKIVLLYNLGRIKKNAKSTRGNFLLYVFFVTSKRNKLCKENFSSKKKYFYFMII